MTTPENEMDALKRNIYEEAAEGRQGGRYILNDGVAGLLVKMCQFQYLVINMIQSGIHKEGKQFCFNFQEFVRSVRRKIGPPAG